MVPQHAHAGSHAHVSRPQPDPVRIAGISGTLLLNIVALCLLLTPMTRPDLLTLPDVPRNPEIRWIDPPAIPPDPPPPQPAELVPPQTVVPRLSTPTPRDLAPQTVDPPPVDFGTLPADPVDPAPPMPMAFGPTVAPPGPVGGVRLEYAHAPPPAYPRDALHGGLQGTVLLEVVVGVDGRPLEVRIHRGSGHRVLDDAARRHVLRRWTFRPAMHEGRPVQAIGLVPIDFNLERG